MRQTSLLAYQTIEPDIGRRRREVYDALHELGEANNRTIAKHLGWEINRVTGRVKELVDLGKVEESRRMPDAETGFKSIIWKVCDA